MHIDLALSSNGTYNNTGSSRQLANYLEHEDLERMEKGIYTEGFFIKDIDSNIGQLLKTDAKFYAIHVSPSEKELRTMGNTEQEQAETMKLYIREVFIPEYAKNFNKELSASDIKFYGKIHFDRSRSDNELNMHCHLIVSRKDQANKKKLSPLTNHKNTKNGIIKGGFDRVNLFRQVEQGFDKLFNYNRQPIESFNYYNTMKNSTISEQKKLQEQEFQFNERKIIINQENGLSINHENKESKNQVTNKDTYITVKQENNTSIHTLFQKENGQTFSSQFFLTSSIIDFPHSEDLPKEQTSKHKNKKAHPNIKP